MRRGLLYLLVAAGVLAAIWFQEKENFPRLASPNESRTAQFPPIGERGARATRTWGNPASLPDHFARHGADFGARNQEEYARMASEFLQRAKVDALSAKIDSDGVLRVYDPRSGTFGAYNRDGTTKTFFKPGNRSYFERQPGQSVDLRTWR